MQFLRSNHDFRFTPPENHESRKRWFARHMVQGLVGNTLVAILITVLVPALGNFIDNLVYSQCIGMAIRFLLIGSMMTGIQGDVPVPWRVAAIVVLASVLGLALGSTLAAWLRGTTTFFFDPQKREALTLPILTITALASLAGTAFFWTREYLASARARADAEHARAESASRQASDAQLRMLRAQLEPHMLFNTLANLRALMSIDAQAAQTMLDRLIAFLRATLAASRSDRVSLADEFKLLDDYLSLIAIRMGDRLHYKLELTETLSDLQVLPMLLQPIVENAIKHGIEPALDGGSITVSTRSDGSVLTIEVVDTGVGLADNRVKADGSEGGLATASGFGLQQIRERLQTAYGERGSADIRPNPPPTTGTTVSLRLPLESRDDPSTDRRG